jgi:hypothetical protein
MGLTQQQRRMANTMIETERDYTVSGSATMATSGRGTNNAALQDSLVCTVSYKFVPFYIFTLYI